MAKGLSILAGASALEFWKVEGDIEEGPYADNRHIGDLILEALRLLTGILLRHRAR